MRQNRAEEGIRFLQDMHRFPSGVEGRAEDYVYSSAIDYAEEKGLLEIVVIEREVGY
ncbi:MAG: hypothetical protein WCI31_04365 [Prolixibacteraceae bacterium]